MISFPYCILEILLVETHIRYMDSLQFARHSILKDRLILKEYNEILLKRQMER